jgi:tRNA threonylcarbamoyl adenosine modification protein YjeE
MINLGNEIALQLADASVVALFGNLGAGKTTLAKGMISALTGTPIADITSPTFQYLAIYENERVVVHHFDLWRLERCDEFLLAGFDEFLTHGISIIEWPERIQEILPPSTMVIEIEHMDEGRRVIIGDGCEGVSWQSCKGPNLSV